MDRKVLLKRVLPLMLIAIIATVIIVVAFIFSKEKMNAQVSDPKTPVYKIGGYELSKGDLYDQLKSRYGIGMLLELVDYELLADIEIDEEEVQKEIDDQIEEKGEDEFKRDMAIIGLTTDEEIFDYYKLTFLKDAAARIEAEKEITEEDLQERYDDYRPDVCGIVLKFSTRTDADKAFAELEGLTGQALLDKYDAIYNDEDNSYNIIKMFGIDKEEDDACEYEKYQYGENKSRSFDKYLFDELKDGEGSEEVKIIDKYRYLVYKVETDEKPSFDSMKDEIKTELLDEIVTSAYINEYMAGLRTDSGLVILDSVLGADYKNYDKDFKISKEESETIIARIDGKEYTADDLFELLKVRAGVNGAMNDINYQILKKLDGVKLTKDEIEDIEEQVESMKAQFLSSGYASMISWSEYINYYYGVKTDEQLQVLLETGKLQEKYIKENDPVTDAEINEAYAEWFEITASHILLEFDEDDADSKQAALDKAKEIIAILDETDADDLQDEFERLAEQYSDGPSASDGGDLGSFGPGQMVKEFEDAVKLLQKDDYTIEPVETEFGLHIILKTGEKEKPTKEDAEDDYDDLIEQITADLEEKKLASDNVGKWMADLRDEKEFSFIDEDLQKAYLKYQERARDIEDEEEEA